MLVGNYNNPPALFDGQDETQFFALVHAADNSSLGVIIDYGEHNATWTGLVARVGGDATSPYGQLWKIEMANTLSDLNTKTGSYQEIVYSRYSSTGLVDIDLGGEYTGKVFKITLTRNDGSGTAEHIAELAPKVRYVDYLP